MDKDKQVITAEQLAELDMLIQSYIPGEYILVFPMVEGHRLVTRMDQEKIPLYLQEVVSTIQADSFHTLPNIKRN